MKKIQLRGTSLNEEIMKQVAENMQKSKDHIDFIVRSNVQETLNERGARYGDFTGHAIIAQDLQDRMRTTQGWTRLDATKRQALTVIADKIARILSGDPNYADNWHDIQGYARLVEERLPK